MRIEVALIKEAMTYNPDTGEFRWLERPRRHFESDKEFRRWNARYSGRLAGGLNVRGYHKITLFNLRLAAHQLAWAMHYGVWPRFELDHIDHDRANNRIANLRDVPHSENSQNMPRSSSNNTGCVGVYRQPNPRLFRACIRVNRKLIHLGTYPTFEDAVAARKHAENVHNFHPNHGTSKSDLNQYGSRAKALEAKQRKGF